MSDRPDLQRPTRCAVHGDDLDAHGWCLSCLAEGKADEARLLASLQARGAQTVYLSLGPCQPVVTPDGVTRERSHATVAELEYPPVPEALAPYLTALITAVVDAYRVSCPCFDCYTARQAPVERIRLMRRLLLLLLCVLLAGCTSIKTVAPDNLQDVVAALQYVRDRHGNCLAVISSETYYGMRVVALAQVTHGCDGP